MSELQDSQANGHAKTKRKRKPTVKKAKVVKVTRGAKKARAPRTLDLTKLDKFGFRLGTIRSKAAAMYGSKGGATLAEVKAKLKGSTQYNLLDEVTERGFKIERNQVKGSGRRAVTRYHIVAK